MKTNTTKRVNITLSQKTLLTIDKIVKNRGRSSFIDRAVNFYVEEVGYKKLEMMLKDGAEKRSERDYNISAEWHKLGEEI